MGPPLAGAPRVLERQLLQAAVDGDLRRFKGMVTALDAGKGCPREAVEAVKHDGAGALHLAARQGRTPVCAYLVEELRVDVNAMDDSGITPLGHAVGAGTVDSVRYLLDHGANPDKTDVTNDDLELQTARRHKAEQEVGTLKEERKKLECSFATLNEEKKKLECSVASLKEEKKKLEYYVADLLKLAHVQKDKMKEIVDICGE
ncbi:hypothetical protein ACQ4PT_064507 [Festuca glaucescens]